MKQYLDMLDYVLTHGKSREDRTGTGTLSVFGYQNRYDLSEGLPLLTTKKVHFKSVLVELLWFLKGDTNIKFLHDNGVTIWDEWADSNGDLGPVYGAQWRNWKTYDEGSEYPLTVDQIEEVLISLKENPMSRRHMVVAWHPGEVDFMALPPCHCLFQFYVDIEDDGTRRLSCQLYQRSADIFLGVPFNIASYAVLTQLIADHLGYKLGEFVHTFGDLHLYKNHIEQAKLQLTRSPRDLPDLIINNHKGRLEDYEYEDFRLLGYNPYPAIKAQVSV